MIKICDFPYPIYDLTKKIRYPICDLTISLNIICGGLLLMVLGLIDIMMKKYFFQKTYPIQD